MCHHEPTTKEITLLMSENKIRICWQDMSQMKLRLLHETNISIIQGLPNADQYQKYQFSRKRTNINA